MSQAEVLQNTGCVWFWLLPLQFMVKGQEGQSTTDETKKQI